MNVISNEADENYLPNIFKENFKLIIIYEFFVSTFTFNIFVELLIIPISTIISIFILLPDQNEKYRNSKGLAGYLSALLGFVFLYKTIEVGINEYHQLNSIDILISFLIPLIYLILVSPIIYIFGLYSKYEMIFLRMPDNEDKKINRHRRFEVLKICNFSIRKVRIFKNEYMPKMYKNITEEDFDNLLDEFKNKN